jgi:hypothetical protein
MIKAVSLAAADQRLPVSPAVRPAEADVPCANPQHRFSASHDGVVANFWAEGAVWKAQVWDLLVLQGVWSSDSVEELFHFVFKPAKLARRGSRPGKVACDSPL